MCNKLRTLLSTMKEMFYDCINITSISFPKLERISGDDALQGFALGCSSLSSITFPALERIEASDVFSNIFSGGNKSLSFPALTTISDNDAFCDIAAITTLTIHFKSGMESTVQGLTGYPNFGGSNTTILFDL